MCDGYSIFPDKSDLSGAEKARPHKVSIQIHLGILEKLVECALLQIGVEAIGAYTNSTKEYTMTLVGWIQKLLGFASREEGQADATQKLTRVFRTTSQGGRAHRVHPHGYPSKKRPHLILVGVHALAEPEAVGQYLRDRLVMVGPELDAEVAEARRAKATRLEVWTSFVLGCPATLYTSTVTQVLDTALRVLGPENSGGHTLIEEEFARFVAQRYHGTVGVVGGFGVSELSLKLVA